MSKIIAIGDIHGNFNKLMSLYHQLDIHKDDTLIFLGDYIDRGNQNSEVVKFIMNLKVCDNIVYLMGNHEDMMLTYFDEPTYESYFNDPMEEHKDDWLYNGGDITKNEFFSNDENQALLKQFINFLKNDTKDFYQLTLDDKKYLFVHAGINPNNKQYQDRDDMLWIRGEFFNNYDGKTTIVCGHTPTAYFDIETKEYMNYYCNEEFIPIYTNNIYAIDTGSYFPGGKITAWIYDNGKITFKQSK